MAKSITYESVYGKEGNFYDQSGVEWTPAEIAACRTSGESEATCPSCGHWMPVSNTTSISCPICNLSKGIISPIVQIQNL